MKRTGQLIYFPIFFICALICLVSCDDGIEVQLPTPSEVAEIDTIPKDELLFVWVDQLNVRTEPNLDSDIVVRLKEGALVTYSNIKSEIEIKVVLRGQNYTGPFYKIKTQSGKEGWVFSAALKKEKPSNLSDYKFSGDSLLLWEDGISSLIIGDELSDSDLMNFGKMFDLKILPETDPMALEEEENKRLLIASNSDVSKNFKIHYKKGSTTIIEKIVIDNSGIADQYGIRVGAIYKDALNKRNRMTQGTNNRGITYAADPDSRIVYELCCPPENSTKTLFTKEEAENWEVVKIIWFRDLFNK